MIVEATILALIGGSAVLGPIKWILGVDKMIKQHLSSPQKRTVTLNGKEVTLEIRDLVGPKGLHTQFQVAQVAGPDGDVWVVLTRAETEMLQMASLLEMAIERGIPVGPGALQRVCALAEERTKEIARSPSRRATIK